MNILFVLLRGLSGKDFPMFSPKLRRYTALSTFVLLIVLVAGFLLHGTSKKTCPIPSNGMQMSANGMVASYVSFVRTGGPGSNWALITLDFESGDLTFQATFTKSPKIALAPSGRTVAAGVERQLTLFHLTDGTSQEIWLPGAIYALEWYPGEQSLVVQTQSSALTQFWLVGTDGSQTLLFEEGESSWAVRFAGVSPDGTRIVLTMENAMAFGPDLYELHLSDGSLHFLMPVGTYWYPNASWSRDSRYLLLKGSLGPGGYVFLVYDTLTGQRLSSGDYTIQVSDAAWMSNTQVVYARYQRGGPALWIWDVQTQQRRQLIQLGSVGYLRLFPYPGGIGTYGTFISPWRIMAFDDGLGGSRQLNVSGNMCR